MVLELMLTASISDIGSEDTVLMISSAGASVDQKKAAQPAVNGCVS